MAGGWSKDGGVQEQIDASISDAVDLARGRIPQGKSLAFCEECEEKIPEARREAILGVKLCIQCQSAQDEKTALSGFNRRGSKDSQLR